MKAEWRYEDVQQKLWSVENITDVWGIGRRTAIRLNRMGIFTMHDLAHANYYQLKQNFGVLGTQLYAHSWGIDRSFLGQKYKVKSKSIGNSQVLNRDYTRRKEIEIVIKEMADQVATRLRRTGAKAEVISLWIGFSMGYVDRSGSRGFHQQMKVAATNSSKQIANYLLQIFDHHYKYQDIRNVGVNCSKLVYSNALQLDLFEDPDEQVKDLKIDYVVDTIRKKFGFKSIVHANSIMEGGRAIARSSLVGGHAGGMSGLEGAESHGKAY
ncbi:DNA directed DNA polymerase [Enterococcus sp. 3G6_DIV0642]|nr:DNA directed DNA polymerase [Enterococcus sp. 3G6_DIV0642]